MHKFYKITDNMTFQERKQIRKEYFEKHVKGWKLKPCTACNGSGYYDTCIKGRIPKCSACNGTGKERYLPESDLKKSN